MPQIMEHVDGLQRKAVLGFRGKIYAKMGLVDDVKACLRYNATVLAAGSVFNCCSRSNV